VDCEETQNLLHGYVDDELDVVSSSTLTQHLQACPACAADSVADERIVFHTTTVTAKAGTG
jgi:anti-sigma factor RsiW